MSKPTEDELNDRADRYFTNASFARKEFPQLVERDPYLNGLVQQLDDVNEAILRRIKQLALSAD